MPKLIEPILPPDGMPWARQTDGRLATLEVDRSRSLMEQVATNKGLGASVASLSEQIADLQGRVSYSASDASLSNWTTTQTANVAWGPILNFTTQQTRVISLDFMVDGHVSVSSVGSASGYVSLKPALFLDGALVGPSQPALNVTLVGSGAEIGAPVTARALAHVPAGNHTLQGGFAWRQVVTTSGSGLLGIITASNPSLFVDILQATGA